MRRVVITMDGGLIQGIMADDDVEILVMDFDTEGAGEEDSDDERRRDAAEAVLAALQVQEEEDAKAEFRLESARDDHARDLRAEREEAEDA